MSKNELAYFYTLDWSDKVFDIREQYPLLNLKQAIKCANEAGVRYPKDNASGFPYVLSCDFLITTADGLKARTIKMKSELQNPRVLEKLEVERRYWAMENVDWRIITEDEISYAKAKNVEWLYTALNYASLSDGSIKAKTHLLYLLKQSNYSILESFARVEDMFLLKKGEGLLLFKGLLLNGEVRMDLTRPVNLNLKGGVEVCSI